MKPVRLNSLPLAVADPAAVSAFVRARLAITIDDQPRWTSQEHRLKLWRMGDRTLQMIGHVFAPAESVPDDVEMIELRCGVRRCRSEHCEVWHRLLVDAGDYLRLMSK